MSLLNELADHNAAIERTILPANIGALFDDSVARHADRLLWVAVDGSEPPLSYHAFAIQVARCAAALQGLGVRHGTHVAVMLPSVPALAITWMALAKLGAVMLPVNTRYTAPELAHVLREGDAVFLLLDGDYFSLLPAAFPPDRIITHGAILPGTAGEFHDLLAAARPTPLSSPPDANALMTLQFTSGSTGAPKACMLPQLYWLTIGLVRAHQGPPMRRMLIDMPFHYMGGQWRFLMALYLGATAYVARQPSLTRMMDRLLQHDIEFCSITPAFAKQPPDPRATRLNLGWAGTMALPATLHAALEERLGGAPVREMYGLTETGAALAMPVSVDWMTSSGSAGLPVPFRRLSIRDANGAEVPIGETGELWISGPGMMTGYYNRPDPPFQDGWFRSGDLFRRDPDGFHFILGRIKDVIRRSGENISASEIETVLCGLPEIVEAAAIAVPDETRGEEVKICVLLQPGLGPEDVPPAMLLDFCRQRLARFKLPRYIAYVTALPKTASGKIAKPALRPAGGDPRAGTYDTELGAWHPSC